MKTAKPTQQDDNSTRTPYLALNIDRVATLRELAEKLLDAGRRWLPFSMPSDGHLGLTAAPFLLEVSECWQRLRSALEGLGLLTEPLTVEGEQRWIDGVKVLRQLAMASGSIEDFDEVFFSQLAVAIEMLNEPKAAKPVRSPNDAHDGKPSASHSDDFRSVRWFGTSYSFRDSEAKVLKVLWEQWENGTPEIGNRTALAKAGLDNERLPDVFKCKGKYHPAWGTMIVPGTTKGTVQLREPKTNNVERKTPR